MEVFYAQHEDTLIEAITPIVRAHLAWMLSSDDPEAIAREIARRHVAESQEQLRNVLVVEDFNKALERMLDRWEQRRADVAADHFVQQGVEYVRSYR